MIDRNGFRVWLVRQGLATRTINTHVARLEYFDRTLSAFSVKEVDAWVCVGIERGLKHNSINSYLKTIKKYGAFINDQSLYKVKLLPPNASLKATLSEEEITRFLSLEPHYTGKMLCHVKRFNMFTVFFAVLAHTGARTHEIIEMTVGQVDLGSNTIMINATKTNDIRYIPISNEVSGLLRNTLMGLSPTDKIFPIKSADHLKKQFRLRLNRLGINRPGLTPYCLRRSFITRMLDTDTNLFAVKTLVGHKKSETTERYYALTQKKLRQAIKKDPLSRKKLTPQEKIILAKETLDELGLLADNDLRVKIQSDSIMLEVI